MSQPDQGGLVHPLFRPPERGEWYIQQGVTRRDLGAIEMAAALVPGYANSIIKPEVVAQEIAKNAYLISDALIAEGKK